ncbi:MAG: threonine/serine dehydratase, partial [Longimicrobiales bacterium]|nr:threonine/serine dehydratase [Longimicrobiales bacterium]
MVQPDAAPDAGPGTDTPQAPDPDLAELQRARERLRGIAYRTPLERSTWLSEAAGVPVYLKLECWQRTRSFKLRGAYNAMAALPEPIRSRGVVTASAGNHGLAVATAARLLDTSATVYVPEGAPATKKRRIREAGGTLREVPGIYDDAAAAARAVADETGAYFLNAFADTDVVAGQGTVGLEILDQLPAVETVLIPVGGGGLAAGVGIAIRSGPAPGARVLGVQSTATTAMHAAFAAGRVVPVDDPVTTLCDGLAGETEPAAYRRARAVMESIHLVDDGAVAPAIRSLFRREGVVAEGSGAVGVAAILAGDVHPKGPTAVVVSGGNIDAAVLARILEDG